MPESYVPTKLPSIDRSLTYYAAVVVSEVTSTAVASVIVFDSYGSIYATDSCLLGCSTWYYRRAGSTRRMLYLSYAVRKTAEPVGIVLQDGIAIEEVEPEVYRLSLSETYYRTMAEMAEKRTFYNKKHKATFNL